MPKKANASPSAKKSKGSRSAPSTKSKPKKTPKAPKAPRSASFVPRPAGFGSIQTTYTRSLPPTQPLRGSQRMQGRDLVATIQTGGVATLGTNLWNAQVAFGGALGMFTGTRIVQIAGTFDKFLFRNISFHWVPAVGTGTNGSLILAYDPDPADLTPAATQQGCQALICFQKACEVSVWQPATLDCPLTDRTALLFTSANSPDERVWAQGQFYVSAGPTGLPINTALGSVYVEYDVEFFDPGVEQLVNQGMSLVSTGAVTEPNTVAAQPTLQADTVSGVIGPMLFNAATGVISNIPSGNWAIDVGAGVQAGTASNTFSPSIIFTGGCIAGAILGAYTTGVLATGAAGTASILQYFSVPAGQVGAIQPVVTPAGTPGSTWSINVDYGRLSRVFGF